jgi:hypothetical protein
MIEHQLIADASAVTTLGLKPAVSYLIISILE